MGNYIDIAYADAFIGINPTVGAIWTAFNNTVKNNWINSAEIKMDEVRWVGEKVNPLQTAQFPRVILDYVDDYTKWNIVGERMQNQITSDDQVIPENIKKATCELIMLGLRSSTFEKFVDMQNVNVQSFVAGNTSFNFTGKKQRYPLPDTVWRMVNYLSNYYWTQAFTIIERY